MPLAYMYLCILHLREISLNDSGAESNIYSLIKEAYMVILTKLFFVHKTLKKYRKQQTC